MAEPRVRHIATVIPAYDEEDLIGAAVCAVRRAGAALGSGVRVETVVVANGCTDRTAEVARAAGAHVLAAPRANVGAARALGFGWALRRAEDAASLWIASTDADTVVPDGWLRSHLALADSGHDVVLGTVALPVADRDRHEDWTRQYQARDHTGGHGHVHGANLGVRGSSYVRAGSFRDLGLGEDVDLVSRLLLDGAAVAWPDDLAVTTSARHRSRVVGGVASDLAASASPPRVA